MTARDLDVHFPLGGRWHVMVWWTPGESNRVVVARSERALVAAARSVFASNADAEVRYLAEVEIVAPSDGLRAEVAAEERADDVRMFLLLATDQVKDMVADGRLAALPPPFAPCEGYDPVDPEDGEDPGRSREHVGCRRCTGGVAIPGMTPEAFHDRYRARWDAIFARRDEASKGPSKGPSKASTGALSDGARPCGLRGLRGLVSSAVGRAVASPSVQRSTESARARIAGSARSFAARHRSLLRWLELSVKPLRRPDMDPPFTAGPSRARRARDDERFGALLVGAGQGGAHVQPADELSSRDVRCHQVLFYYVELRLIDQSTVLGLLRSAKEAAAELRRVAAESSAARRLERRRREAGLVLEVYRS